MASSLDTLAFSGAELTDAQLEQADGGMCALLIAGVGVLCILVGGLIDNQNRYQ